MSTTTKKPRRRATKKPRRRATKKPRAPKDTRPLGTRWDRPLTLEADWRLSLFRYRMDKKLSAGMPEHMKETFRAAADRMGISMAELVRRLFAREFGPK